MSTESFVGLLILVFTHYWAIRIGYFCGEADATMSKYLYEDDHD